MFILYKSTHSNSHALSGSSTHTHTRSDAIHIHTLLENKPIYIRSVHYQICTRNHISRLAISKDIKHANSLHCQIEVSRSFSTATAHACVWSMYSSIPLTKKATCIAKQQLTHSVLGSQPLLQ